MPYFILIIVLAILVWHKQLYRIWKLILFAFSILTNGSSRVVNLLAPGIDRIDATYSNEGQEQELLIYQPCRSSKPLPAIILYHGASPKGVDQL